MATSSADANDTGVSSVTITVGRAGYSTRRGETRHRVAIAATQTTSGKWADYVEKFSQPVALTRCPSSVAIAR